MKVIQPPQENGYWTLEQKCSGAGNHNDGCGATLEIGHKDLFLTQHHSYDGSSESYLTFECVCCQVWTDVPQNKVPSGIVSKVFRSEARSPTRRTRVSNDPL